MTADTRAHDGCDACDGFVQISLDPSLPLVLLGIPHRREGFLKKSIPPTHHICHIRHLCRVSMSWPRHIRHWCGVQVSPHLSQLSLKPWQRSRWGGRVGVALVDGWGAAERDAVPDTRH